jgi:hypothetical protein
MCTCLLLRGQFTLHVQFKVIRRVLDAEHSSQTATAWFFCHAVSNTIVYFLRLRSCAVAMYYMYRTPSDDRAH